MLIPRRVKHRKQHHPGRTGAAKGGTRVTFGDYGIQALEPAYVTNRQIESARIAMTRHIKRGGKVWINIYPDRPLTKKPAETRMGSGKGSPEWWIANVKPGRVMFELSGVPEPIAREAHAPGDAQAPDEVPVRPARGGTDEQPAEQARGPDPRRSRTTSSSRSCGRPRRSCSTCASRRPPASWRATAGCNAVRKDIARIYTIMRERELGISTVETDDEAPA